MDKDPYVKLERLTVGLKRSFDGDFKRVSITKRSPVVVLEKLPINIFSGVPEDGEHASRHQEETAPKRQRLRGPQLASPETPTKHANFSNKSPRQLPQMSLIGSTPKAAKENLSVLLGVRSKGVPIVELERLEDIHSMAHIQATASTSGQNPDVPNNAEDESDSSSSVLLPLRARRRKKASLSPRKAAPVRYRETDSSDDNWSVSSLRLWR